MSEQFLYQKLDVLKEFNNLKNLPEIIEKGLSENISLREYQKDAFQYFVTYFENKELRKNNQLPKPFEVCRYQENNNDKNQIEDRLNQLFGKENVTII